MKTNENSRIPIASHLSKWMTVGVMQRMDQMQCVAEMLASYMEDIYDQLANVESNMENMQEGIESVQQEIEDLACLIENRTSSCQNDPDISCIDAHDESLPF